MKEGETVICKRTMFISETNEVGSASSVNRGRTGENEDDEVSERDIDEDDSDLTKPPPSWEKAKTEGKQLRGQEYNCTHRSF